MRHTLITASLKTPQTSSYSGVRKHLLYKSFGWSPKLLEKRPGMSIPPIIDVADSGQIDSKPPHN